MTFRENTVVELHEILPLVGGGQLYQGHRGTVVRTLSRPLFPDDELVLVHFSPIIGLPDFFRVWVDARRLKVPSP